jgi:hypothetical protein
MAEFEKIEPTNLLNRIRSGEVDENDPLAIGARNFATFLRPHIERMVEDIQRQTRDGSTFGGGLEEVAEIVRTGIQLAVEHQEDMMISMLPTQIDGNQPF